MFILRIQFHNSYIEVGFEDLYKPVFNYMLSALRQCKKINIIKNFSVIGRGYNIVVDANDAGEKFVIFTLGEIVGKTRAGIELKTLLLQKGAK